VGYKISCCVTGVFYREFLVLDYISFQMYLSTYSESGTLRSTALSPYFISTAAWLPGPRPSVDPPVYPHIATDTPSLLATQRLIQAQYLWLFFWWNTDVVVLIVSYFHTKIWIFSWWESKNNFTPPRNTFMNLFPNTSGIGSERRSTTMILTRDFATRRCLTVWSKKWTPSLHAWGS
jgi:hypothetical protein